MEKEMKIKEGWQRYCTYTKANSENSKKKKKGFQESDVLVESLISSEEVELYDEITKMKNDTLNLQLSLQRYKGDDLNSAQYEELNELEKQLENALNKIRARKLQLMQQQMENLKRTLMNYQMYKQVDPNAVMEQHDDQQQQQQHEEAITELNLLGEQPLLAQFSFFGEEQLGAAIPTKWQLLCRHLNENTLLNIYSFEKAANSHYHAGNGDGTLFPVVPSVQPCSESFPTSEHESSEAILNTLSSNLESVNGLKLQPQSANDLESAAQNAVLHEQEIAAQEVIQSQRFFYLAFNFNFLKLKLYKRNGCFTTISLLKSREARDASGPKESSDFFSGRHDPNALKEHLLQMTAEHRIQMAAKRGNKTQREQELPEYLKQKLKARGILKDDSKMENHAISSNSSTGQLSETSDANLPVGWFWEKSVERSIEAPALVSGVCSGLPEYWREVRDESTDEALVAGKSATQGKNYTRTVLGQSQEQQSLTSPGQTQAEIQVQVAIQHHDRAVASNATNVTWVDQAFTYQRCIECGGWGVGLVQSWGYCKHCTRVVGLKGVQPRAADTTATIPRPPIPFHECVALQSGPLFQQLPYPSPGAVLRKNAEIASQRKNLNQILPLYPREVTVVMDWVTLIEEGFTEREFFQLKLPHDKALNIITFLS
ncbi:hypothetical protein RND71_028161 [Anisodus tanguticus]|uniref:K-box domain-containing protein n=1 Tax=Anisodus tanguticus TaxID=243964 RepID=A0AAE1V1C1_9SOLA|nr:hypothetical protein RND71_028161 [Anisodus tanguticus]